MLNGVHEYWIEQKLWNENKKRGVNNPRVILTCYTRQCTWILEQKVWNVKWKQQEKSKQAHAGWSPPYTHQKKAALKTYTLTVFWMSFTTVQFTHGPLHGRCHSLHWNWTTVNIHFLPPRTNRQLRRQENFYPREQTYSRDARRTCSSAPLRIFWRIFWSIFLEYFENILPANKQTVETPGEVVVHHWEYFENILRTFYPREQTDSWDAKRCSSSASLRIFLRIFWENFTREQTNSWDAKTSSSAPLRIWTQALFRWHLLWTT